jgi:hypothetical protein
VKIVAETGFAIINESDYNPDIHTLLDEKPSTKKTKSSTNEPQFETPTV